MLNIIDKDVDQCIDYGNVDEVKKKVKDCRSQRQLIATVGNYLQPMAKR